MTGDNYWLYIGPVVFFVTLIGWVCLLLIPELRRGNGGTPPEDLHNKGPVAGAIIEGSPAQVKPGSLADYETPVEHGDEGS
jgi:hypothetical protein